MAAHPSTPISPSEASLLPRADRINLSRLRCGHHPAILSNEHRPRPDTLASCHWRRGPLESIVHLFSECPGLGVECWTHDITSPSDLWNSTSSSLSFLRETPFCGRPTRAPPPSLQFSWRGNLRERKLSWRRWALAPPSTASNQGSPPPRPCSQFLLGWFLVSTSKIPLAEL